MAQRLLTVFLAVNLISSLGTVHGHKYSCTPPTIPTPPPGTGTPTPPAIPAPAPPTSGTCPINTLRLAVCANVLRLNIGVPPEDDERCCPLLQGLVDLDAAVCLCLAIRANILGIVLDLPVDLRLLLNFCRKDAAAGFTCPT